jgi:hypothetical protein
MQASWYELALAAAHRRAGDLPNAITQYGNVVKVSPSTPPPTTNHKPNPVGERRKLTARVCRVTTALPRL